MVECSTAHFSFVLPSPFPFLLSLSQIVLMRDLTDGLRASLSFLCSVFSLLFHVTSPKNDNRSAIGLLRPTRQHSRLFLSSCHLWIAR
jgi:hypothetical protein